MHVKDNRQDLKARGERTEDLMINLFKGYLSVSDKDFVFCIKTKKCEYNEGKDICEDQLMKLALNKCVDKKIDSEWSAP